MKTARQTHQTINEPFCVFIRAMQHPDALHAPKWRVLKRVASRQEALQVVNEHQRDLLNMKRFQYRIA